MFAVNVSPALVAAIRKEIRTAGRQPNLNELREALQGRWTREDIVTALKAMGIRRPRGRPPGKPTWLRL
jgi:hypothetical protein